jgi:L-methionine (R)-S-oxide reductase
MTEKISPQEKTAAYEQLIHDYDALMEGENDLLAAMSSMVCLLHQAFSTFYWTGFYRRVAEQKLLVGPYQGTVGCLWIDFSRGVCGACASREQTIIVPDVHAFPGHIACDSRSLSEIVVPVFNARQQLIAVLDIDSDQLNSFDQVDRQYLEELVGRLSRCTDARIAWVAGD